MDNIIGTIIKIEDKQLKSGVGYKKITLIKDKSDEFIEMNAFPNRVNLDVLVTGAVLNFVVDKKEKFIDLLSVGDVPSDVVVELTDEQTDLINAFLESGEKPVKKMQDYFPKDNKNSVEPEFIMLNGKKYVTHKGLLRVAHSVGLASVITELVSFVNNFAIMKSTVTMKDKSIFICYGDANPDNVNSNIAKHLIRMAETRATNRALRLATNIGECSIEELDESEDNGQIYKQI